MSKLTWPILVCIALLLSPHAETRVGAPRADTDSALMLRSDDAQLVARFQWAKRQALAYAFDDDPVGPWYEAALPGREAFCMRDVSHQATGAHALGLAGIRRTCCAGSPGRWPNTSTIRCSGSSTIAP